MAFTPQVGTRSSQAGQIWPGSAVNAIASYVTRVVIGQAYSPVGPTFYTTPVNATCDISGDLFAHPPLGGTGTYITTVRVGQHYAGAAPQLVLWITRVTVGQIRSSSTPIRYTTHVGVSQRSRGRHDGRLDLLGLARYRR